MTAIVSHPQQSEAFRFLQDSALFTNVQQRLIAMLAEQTSTRTINKGDILYLHETPAKELYLIQSGWVKLFRETFNGDEAIIDILTERHVFGDSALFGECFYAESAQAVESATIFSMPVHLFKDALHEDATLSLNLLTILNQHRKRQTMELEHLTTQNASQRIGCFLLRLCVGQEGESDIMLRLPYDKTLIATRLGMQSETFSRALKKLKQETHLSIDGANVTIHNINELVMYCCTNCSAAFPCETER